MLHIKFMALKIPVLLIRIFIENSGLEPALPKRACPCPSASLEGEILLSLCVRVISPWKGETRQQGTMLWEWDLNSHEPFL